MLFFVVQPNPPIATPTSALAINEMNKPALCRVDIFYNLLGLINVPHRTGLEAFPHPALQEHILNARIEYKS
ncbi:MAG: hypothetical protein U9O41_01210, partial [Candidatus Aerophobetes bacterium]|nr:hypothetical protein [Candidatus Aerophobetes bacterium]